MRGGEVRHSGTMSSDDNKAVDSIYGGVCQNIIMVVHLNHAHMIQAR